MTNLMNLENFYIKSNLSVKWLTKEIKVITEDSSQI